MMRRQANLTEGKSLVNSRGSVNGSASNISNASYGENTALKIDQLPVKDYTPLFVYVLTVFSALGGFLFGYDTGVISGSMILLRDYFVLNSVWQELIVSITVGAAAIFALVAGLLNDQIGRKPVILLASIVFTAGALFLGLAKDKYMLLVGRFIVGIGIGFASMSVPMYIAECSPKSLRGRLVVVNQLFIALGMAVAAVIAGIFSTDHKNGWRYMLGLSGVPSVIQFIGLIFMPESPRWLVTKGRDEDARDALQKIRGTGDIDDEYLLIKSSCEAHEEQMKARSESPIIWQILKTPATRRALIIGCSLQMFQQLAGINTVMYYGATIIKMSGIKSEELAIWLAALIATVNAIFSIVGLLLVDKFGRRPLTLGSLFSIILSLAWLAIGFQVAAMNSPLIQVHEKSNVGSPCDTYLDCDSCVRDLHCGFCYKEGAAGVSNSSCLQSEYHSFLRSMDGPCNSSSVSSVNVWAYDFCPTKFAWVPIVGLVLYLISFAPGLGPMPWTINSEIYPLWARSTGNSVATFFNWVFNLTISMSFLSLTEVLTIYGTFWLYAGISTIGLVFFAFLLPETKDKSLEEVEGLFAKAWCGECGGGDKEEPQLPFNDESVQYVHIRGLNRDGHSSDLESPE